MIRFLVIWLRCLGLGWHRWTDGSEYGGSYAECMDCGCVRRLR